MTVVEGWFGDNEISDEQFDKDSMALDDDLKNIIAEQCSINRTAYLIFTDAKAEEQTENANETDAATKSVAAPVATVIGNKTEGALINMIRAWGYDYDDMKAKNFNQKTDRIFSFNSDKKRSSAVIVRADGTVRVYCKGAAETLLEDCLHYRNKNGQKVVINKETKLKLERKINGMAERALRTLLLCHKDYPSLKSLPHDWKDCCPDSDGLCCDCIVGIIGTQSTNSWNSKLCNSLRFLLQSLNFILEKSDPKCVCNIFRSPEGRCERSCGNGYESRGVRAHGHRYATLLHSSHSSDMLFCSAGCCNLLYSIPLYLIPLSTTTL